MNIPTQAKTGLEWATGPDACLASKRSVLRSRTSLRSAFCCNRLLVGARSEPNDAPGLLFRK